MSGKDKEPKRSNEEEEEEEGEVKNLAGTAKEEADALKNLGGDDDTSNVKVDKGKAQAALASVGGTQQKISKEDEEKEAKAKALAAVIIKKEDVDILISEFEVEKKYAEQHLRLSGGDLKVALTSLIISSK